MLPSSLFLGANNAKAQALIETLDLAGKMRLSDVALSLAKTQGATYADFRLCRYQTEYFQARERRLEESSIGFQRRDSTCACC